jgi:hypothetical protein
MCGAANLIIITKISPDNQFWIGMSGMLIENGNLPALIPGWTSSGL